MIGVCIKHGNIKLFADDTTCKTSCKCINNVHEKMKLNLSDLKKWFDADKLTLNLSKTSYCIFHSIRKIVLMSSTLFYSVTLRLNVPRKVST